METKNASAAARNQTRTLCATNGAVTSCINCATMAAPEQVTYSQLRQTMFAVDLRTLTSQRLLLTFYGMDKSKHKNWVIHVAQMGECTKTHKNNYGKQR